MAATLYNIVLKFHYLYTRVYIDYTLHAFILIIHLMCKRLRCQTTKGLNIPCESEAFIAIIHAISLLEKNTAHCLRTKNKKST